MCVREIVCVCVCVCVCGEREREREREGWMEGERVTVGPIYPLSNTNTHVRHNISLVSALLTVVHVIETATCRVARALFLSCNNVRVRVIGYGLVFSVIQ